MPSCRPRRKRRGWTLLEILVVLAIIALIASGVAFALMRQAETAKIRVTKQSALTLRSIVTSAKLEGAPGCPTVPDLVETKRIDRAAKGTDAWDRAFVVECAEDDITVASGGPDGQVGTSDDVRAP